MSLEFVKIIDIKLSIYQRGVYFSGIIQPTKSMISWLSAASTADAAFLRVYYLDHIYNKEDLGFYPACCDASLQQTEIMY